jgi:hypothetical protein
MVISSSWSSASTSFKRQVETFGLVEAVSNRKEGAEGRIRVEITVEDRVYGH